MLGSVEMFLAKEIGNQLIRTKKWGLVLSGGGGKGAYQIGALEALSECGLLQNIIACSGVSVGALNMCILAQQDLNIGSAIWSDISYKKLLDPDIKLFDGKEGLFKRDGLNDIINQYINLEKIVNSKIELYACASQYKNLDDLVPKAMYFSLNNQPYERIRKILLASSALPIVYEPVAIDEFHYRDGGLTDNMPVRPLYDKGIRNFIVICLSDDALPPTVMYGDAEYIFIKPSKNLGDLLTGTLDFNAKNANIRLKLGYLDTVRVLKYYQTEESKSKDFKVKFQQMAESDYNQILMESKIDERQKQINKSVSNVKEIFDQIENI